jgi:hypothetical protein
MLRILRTTTSLTPLLLALLPGTATAQLTISTETTSAVRTATASNGSPANIVVTDAGVITLSSGSAITMDSANTVSNAGKLTLGSADGTTGIDVLGGLASTITNSGTISITESFVAADDDSNYVVDGPIAKATDRAGIRLRGTFTGDVTNSGTIAVEGLNSAGIRVDGALTGSILSSGAITVVGDYGAGIRAGDVSGNVAIDGKITVVGEGARALDLTGNIGGVLRLQNTITQLASYTNDNSVTLTLSRSDLRVGAPAVSVAGNVAGGIIIAVPPTTSSTNTDVDGDGILDANEGTGVIQSYGNGPALRIGGASDTTIGAVSGNGHSLVVQGSVLSNAYYSNTDTTALVIGGQGGAVSLPGGISVTGRVVATTNDASATGILINAGSTVPVIDNSGTIGASISSPGEGATYAIRDLSGTLTTINTNGYITAGGSGEDVVVAIDLSANTSGVTINQYTPPDETDSLEATITTQITGAILTGSGDDLITVSDGQIKGNASLGAGNDRVALSGDAIYQGKVDFGSGIGTLTLADTSQFIGTAAFNDFAGTITLSGSALYSGTVTGGANLAVTVNGGTLYASGTSDVAFQTLNVASGGTIKVAIDGETHTNPKFVVGTATFADGAHVAASISTLSEAEGSYVVLTAGQITGTPSFSSDETDLPFLFKGAVSVDQSAGEVILDIERKTASELGLNRSQAAAYSAILAAAPADTSVEASLLEVEDQATLATQFNGLLPDHAGGTFDLLTRGSRLATRHLTNNNTLFDISDFGGWFEVLKWHGSKDATDTAGYSNNGWGLSGGWERKTGIGNLGLSFAWLSGTNENAASSASVKANAYEFGAFWRLNSGPFYAFARVGFTLSSFEGSRTFTGTVSDTDFTRTATADWKGRLYSGTAGISYQVEVGDRISFKPMAIFDYYRLHENGYTESGGGDAMNLIVAGRTSDAAYATTTLTGIYRFGTRSNDGIPLTIELEGGRRNRIGGALGNTVAHFTDGADFTLTPDALKGNWLAEARILSGGLDYTWTVSANAEQTQGSPAYSARISLGVAF